MAEEKAGNMIREAESAKAHIYDIPGNECEGVLNFINAENAPMQNTSAAKVDEDYMLVASHLDENLRAKILNQEYVDFAKLLKCDRGEDDGGQKMINTCK